MLVANRNGLVGKRKGPVGSSKKIVLVGNSSVLSGKRKGPVGSSKKIVLVGNSNKIVLIGQRIGQRGTESGNEEMMIEREMSEADKKESWAALHGRTTCLVTEVIESMMKTIHSIGLCVPFRYGVIMQKRICVNGYMNLRQWLRSLVCCVRKASNIVMLLLLMLMLFMVVSNVIEMPVGSWNLYVFTWSLLRR